MSEFNFEESLDIVVEEVEKPPLPPTGNYMFKVNKLSFDVVGTNPEFDVINFILQAVQPIAGVDQEKLDEVGGPSGINMRHSFMFPRGDDEETVAKRKKTLYYLKVFLTEHLGVETEGMKMREACDSAMHAQCMADIVYKPDKDDPQIIHANIGRTAPLS